MSLSIGTVHVNFHCQESEQPKYVTCDEKDLRSKDSQESHKTVICKSGVKFYLEYNYDQVRLKKIRVAVTLKEKSQSQEEIPPHIFGELVNTREGVAFFREHNYLEHLEDQLKNGTIL